MFSAKTRNVYFIDKKEYKQMLQENLSAKYRKTDSNYLNNINNEALSIMKEIQFKGKENTKHSNFHDFKRPQSRLSQ